MIIDIHGHLGNINFAPFWQADAAKLDAYCREAGVDRLCISSSRALMYDVGEGNRELDAALRHSERLFGYVVVNPVFPDSVAELAWLERNPKFVGVKIHPDYHGYDFSMPSMQKSLDPAAEATGLMLFHCSCMPGTGFADPVVIANFARRHPRTNFVLAHLAGIFQNPTYPYFPNLAGLERVAALKLDNVFIDTAHYLMYVYPGIIEKAVSLIGAAHLVFGTDAPLQNGMQMRFAREAIEAAEISDADQKAILGGNAGQFIHELK